MTGKAQCRNNNYFSYLVTHIMNIKTDSEVRTNIRDIIPCNRVFLWTISHPIIDKALSIKLDNNLHRRQIPLRDIGLSSVSHDTIFRSSRKYLRKSNISEKYLNISEIFQISPRRCFISGVATLLYK